MLGSFASGTGRTLPDRYIEGTCPICGYVGARGDQCDNCGNQLDPTDLIDPRSTIDGRPPDFRETEHFFLDLPAMYGLVASRLGVPPERCLFVDDLAENVEGARRVGMRAIHHVSVEETLRQLRAELGIGV